MNSQKDSGESHTRRGSFFSLFLEPCLRGLQLPDEACRI